MPEPGQPRGPLFVYRDLEGDPANCLAFEADLLEQAGAGRRSLFVYSWNGPVVVIGYGQKADDLNLAWVREHGVPVYRRITGGTGVVHRRDLAVSLFLHEGDPWATGIIGLYDRFLGVLGPALARAGGSVERKRQPVRGARVRSPICFEDQLADTLVAGGRKVVGCAQARRSHGILIHALVSLNLDARVYAGVFRTTRERILGGLGEAVRRGNPVLVAAEVEDAFVGELGIEKVPITAPSASAGWMAAYSTNRWCLAE